MIKTLKDNWSLSKQGINYVWGGKTKGRRNIQQLPMPEEKNYIKDTDFAAPTDGL